MFGRQSQKKRLAKQSTLAGKSHQSKPSRMRVVSRAKKGVSPRSYLASQARFERSLRYVMGLRPKQALELARQRAQR